MMQELQDYSGWIVAVLAGVTALGVIGRWSLKRLRRLARRLNDVSDTLLGREAITHPDTGTVLAPATPSLGTRLATLEETLVKLNDTHTELNRMAGQIDALAARVDQYESATLARTEEHTEMWKAIRALTEWDGVDRRNTSNST